MVVAHTVHNVVALVVAAGHKGEVAHLDGGYSGAAVGVDLGGVPRVFHAAYPLGAVRLGADGPQVAAHADEGAGQAPGFGGLCGLLHGVALAHAAHVQRHGRVGQIDRFGIFINDEVGDIAVLCGGIQLFLRGQLVVAVVVIGQCGLAVVVPDVQHTAQRNVQLAAGGVVHGLGQLQHPEDLVIHRHRGSARIVVDGLDVGHTIVIIINIIELVVLHKVGVECVHLGGELFLAVAVGDDLRHGVEHIIEHGGVTLRAIGGAGGGGAGGAAAASQQAQAERSRQQGGKNTLGHHALAVSFAAVKAVCSS